MIYIIIFVYFIVIVFLMKVSTSKHTEGFIDTSMTANRSSDSGACASSEILFNSKDGIVTSLLGNQDKVDIQDFYDDEEPDEKDMSETDKKLGEHNNRMKKFNEIFFSSYDNFEKVDWGSMEDYKFVDNENYETLIRIKSKTAYFKNFMINWGHLIFAPIFWYICYRHVNAIRGNNEYPNWSIVIIPITIVYLWKTFNNFSLIKISF